MKALLDGRFKIKDLGNLKFFLGVEVARSAKRIPLYQRKYNLDLLQDTILLGAKPISTPIDFAIMSFNISMYVIFEMIKVKG